MTHRTIVCFGDSNTHGTIPTLSRTGGHRFARDRRWTGVMAKRLGAEWYVIEEGQGGRTTVHDDPIEGRHKNGARALPVCLESHMPIDVMILSLGVNDLKARFSASPGDVASALETLVTTILRSGAGPGGSPPKVLLVAPPPIHEVDWFADMFRGGRDKSLQLPELIDEVSRRTGVGYFDAGTVVETSVIDGVHLDEDAHRTLGGELAREVANLNGHD
jgi:lysophospholipase L1-like esterase